MLWSKGWSAMLKSNHIQQLIWKPSYYGSSAQESHYRAKAQIWQAIRRKKILGVSPFRGLLKGMEKLEHILGRIRQLMSWFLAWMKSSTVLNFLLVLSIFYIPSKPQHTSQSSYNFSTLQGAIHIQGENKAPPKPMVFMLHTICLLPGITRNEGRDKNLSWDYMHIYINKTFLALKIWVKFHRRYVCVTQRSCNTLPSRFILSAKICSVLRKLLSMKPAN